MVPKPGTKKKSTAAGTAPSSAATEELALADAHYKSPLPAGGVHPAFEFKAYKRGDVKAALYKDFFDKCAYCESRYATTAPVDVEHFRPKGRVKGDDTHPGYWWLAMRWENLLPACIFCNRHNKHSTPTPPPPPKKAGDPVNKLALNPATGKLNSSRMLTTGKQDAFPVKKTRLLPHSLDYASEEALLLDPCTDDPEEYLHFHIDATAPLGLVLPKALVGTSTLDHVPLANEDQTVDDIVAHAAGFQVSERGAVSIQTYGLNRLQLVRERTRVLHRLEFFEHMLMKIAALIQDLQTPPVHQACKDRNDRAVASLKTMHAMIAKEIGKMADASAPYSVMVQAWVKDFKLRVGTLAPGAAP